MTLLLRTLVVVAILVVSTTATPPPGYVKKPDNDEHPPSYQYKYEVQDEGGDRYGKVETRHGEHARGQYYINSKRSSTDVKYIADEWGYHPFVKYDSSDDHSRASASFAIGEKAVQNLRNENAKQSIFSFPNSETNSKIVQIIQPYGIQRSLLTNGTSKSSSSESVVFSSNLNDSEIHQSSVNFVPARSFDANSVAESLQSHIVKADSSAGDQYFLTTDQESEIIKKDSDLVSSNDLTSTISEEDQLVVENAGSFGQRLQVQGDDASVYSASTTTSSSVSVPNEISNGTRDSSFFRSQVRQNSGKLYLPNTIPRLGVYSSTAFPTSDISVTANSIESESSGVYDHENNGVFKSTGLKIYTVSGENIVNPSTSNSLLVKYDSSSIVSSDSKTEDGFVSKNEEYAFSKPIVVPDNPKETPFQYSTTFKCEDDTLVNTPNPLESLEETVKDTISSHILNPIQAGVALVNAGETHLISNGNIPDEKPPAPVNEKVEDIPQADQATNQLQNTIGAQESNYVGINPAFGIQQEVTESQPQGDQMVEIQSPVEVYQNPPNQNIQVSQQSTVSPISNINKQQNLQFYEIQQQQISKANEFNGTRITSKQDDGQVRRESLSNIYEISDNYAKDSIGTQQVYVVPPATYIVEDSSILKNSLLQEKAQQYVTDSTSSQLYFENQKNIEESQDNTSYEKETSRKYLPSTDIQSEANLGTMNEKPMYTSHVQSVEKIIEKKVPYPIEKIIEKKIPIPQPYPIPVEVPVPQPLPIPVEKIVEKKVPVPVHIPIPHPFPVEKTIHIPVPIEKIVEKPVHIPIPVEKIIEKKIPIPQPYPIKVEKIIERKVPYPIEVTKYVEKPINIHAPYGVQYGVSYQQIMKPQNQGLYSIQSNNLLSPLYALSLPVNNAYVSNNNKNDINVNKLNYTQPFQGYIYGKPTIPFEEEKGNIENNQLLNSKTATKKLAYNSYTPSYYLANTLLHRRHAAVHRLNKFERDDYLGPVPPLFQVQRQYGFQTKTYSPYSSIDRTQHSRQGRNHEPVRYQKGNFRQSKIEYGFKPPMVPSVQYDEETASKVES